MNTCHQGYEVIYSSIKSRTTTTTRTESITIPDLYTYFEFDITIRPTTASSDLSYRRATFYDQKELDVQFTISTQNSSQVIVTWTHPNQDWCSLPFMVTYQTPSGNQVVNVIIHEVVFGIVYCTPTSLTIHGINPNDGSLLSLLSAAILDATQLLSTLLIIGCLGCIVILSIVLTSKQYDCYLGSHAIPITGITFKQLDKNVMVTWDRPDKMKTCNQGYDVTYSSIKGEVSTTTPAENIAISDFHICFEFNITIRPITASSRLSYGKATFRDPRKLDVRFSTSTQNSSRVMASWTHPNQEWCSLPFMVSYRTPSDNMVVKVTAPEVEFSFVLCRPVSLTIRGINPRDDSLLSSYSATVVDATQYPEKIRHDPFTRSESMDDKLVTSWHPVEPIAPCNITYQTVFSTDLGRFTLKSEEPSVTLSREFFCFRVKAIIQAALGKKVIDIEQIGITYGIGPVDDLVLNVNSANSTITATWSSEPLGGRTECGIKYEITLQRGNSMNVLTKSAPNITFDLIYCVNTTISVRVLRNQFHPSEKTIVTNPEEFPTSLEPIRNLSLNRTEASVLLSWETSTSVINCDDLYNVTARNDRTSEESTCQGTTGCKIFLSDFCPQTVFRIKPAELEGEEVIQTLTC